MQYRPLPSAGISVSRISLGTMTFGDQTDEATSIKIIESALDTGINFIDTADVYVNGKSEEIVGKALRGKRDRVVLASKVEEYIGGDEIKDTGLHRWHIIKGVESCLKRLQTECLDICYLHQPDMKTPIEETLSAFDVLVQQGKVMYLGMSNFAAWQVCEALWKADKRGYASPVIIQVPYNLLTRGIDEECVGFCEQMHIGMSVYNPLAAGLLTGKHSREKGPAAGSRLALSEGYRQRYWSHANFDALEELTKIADQAGITITALSLQWLASKEYVSSIVLGVSKLPYLEQNLKAWEDQLSDDTLSACDAVWMKIRGNHYKYNR